MNKLIIKTESLPERCEVCHQSDKFDSQTGFCSRCSICLVTDKTIDFINKPPINKYSTISIEKNSDELIIINRWFSGLYIFFIFFFILIDICIIGVIKLIIEKLQMLNTNADIVMFIFAGIIIFGVLFLLLSFTYLMIAGIFNKTIVKVNKNELSIWHGPLPWRKQLIIQNKEINQIYYGEIHNRSNKGRTKQYQLNAKLNNGKTIKLISESLNPEIAKYIEHQIENYLSIENKSVKGELATNN